MFFFLILSLNHIVWKLTEQPSTLRTKLVTAIIRNCSSKSRPGQETGIWSYISKSQKDLATGLQSRLQQMALWGGAIHPSEGSLSGSLTGFQYLDMYQLYFYLTSLGLREYKNKIFLSTKVHMEAFISILSWERGFSKGCPSIESNQSYRKHIQMVSPTKCGTGIQVYSVYYNTTYKPPQKKN